MSWEKVKIKEVYAGLFDGPHATPPDSEDGAVFLGISNITPDGHIDLGNIKHINENDLPKWTKRVVPTCGDIVFSYEATLNLYAIIPEGFWGCLGRRMALIRPDETKAHGKFLYYYFFSDEWRKTIAENTVTGATVDRIPIARFPDFLISLPPLPNQHRIASVLSAYDKLIENNQKQIKLLEEAAQRLYKEWFVDLGFPGHESISIADGKPNGWKLQPLKDFVGYEIGGGWGEDCETTYCTVPAFVIRGTDFYGISHGNLSSIPYRYHVEGNLNARRLIDGDIIFEVSGGSRNEGVARTALITTKLLDFFPAPIICASFCKLIRPKEVKYSNYLFSTFQYLRASGKTSEYDKRSASSIVNYRWKDFLEQQLIFVPDNQTLERYNKISQDIFSSIAAKSIQISLLSMMQKKLLQKLMCGEMEVQ